MSREGGFPKYQSERISLCPLRRTQAKTSRENSIPRARNPDRPARCQTSATLESFINRKAREITPGSNALSHTEFTDNRS
jgi:hypothetical protein